MCRLVTGGQTGVDRAALDVARELGLPHGGWCPAGRWAEDGVIPPEYPLDETPSADPRQRTEWNVRDSDVTWILTRGPLQGGTRYAWEVARRLGKPVRIFEVDRLPDSAARAALRTELARIDTLHVAGPRESEAPGIGAAARAWLRAVLGHGEPEGAGDATVANDDVEHP